MTEILFSIFMCARNAEKTIKRAIDSVLDQTFPEWELIVVDNGSTGKIYDISCSG